MEVHNYGSRGNCYKCGAARLATSARDTAERMGSADKRPELLPLVAARLGVVVVV